MNESKISERTIGKFVRDSLRKESRKLGFLPANAITTLVGSGRYKLQTASGELVGFCAWGPKMPETKIYYAYIGEEARRKLKGSTAVHEAMAAIRKTQAIAVSLHCLRDNPAIEFWAENGFAMIEERRKSENENRVQWKMRLPMVWATIFSRKLEAKIGGSKTAGLIRFLGATEMFNKAALREHKREMRSGE